MRLWEFMVRRLIAAIPIIVGLSVLIFFVTHVVPADPARLYAGYKASPETIAAIRKMLHLEDPLPLQYWYYLIALFHGDLGYSLSIRMTVLQGISLFLPTTLGLSLLTVAWSTPAGIFLGIISATKRNRISDTMSRGIAYFGLSVPTFFLAILVQIIFVVHLKILPLTGMLYPGQVAPARFTGFYPVDSILTGNLPVFASSIIHLALPIFALGFSEMSLVLRMTRSSMLEILSSSFVRTLRAKGVPENAIIFKYAFRAAMGPTLTVIGLSAGGLLGGTVFIEEIFGLSGFSNWAYQAILGFDYNVVVAFTLIIAIVYMLANIVVDIAYAWIEPQIRLSEEVV
jgi:peptide/nickel transport system permease protein